MNNAFPPEFLQPLLRISQLEEPGLRVVVQEILHTLLDRHDNASKLKTVRWASTVNSLLITQVLKVSDVCMQTEDTLKQLIDEI